MNSKKQTESNGYNESDTKAALDGPRPIHDPRIGRFKDRLREEIGQRGVRDYAAVTRISEGALFSYLKGATYPTLDRLDTLIHVSGRPLEWFLSIETAPQSHSQEMRLDLETLREAIEVTDIVLEMQGIAPDRADRARLYSLVYDYLRDDATAATSGQAMAGVLRLIRGGRR